MKDLFEEYGIFVTYFVAMIIILFLFFNIYIEKEGQEFKEMIAYKEVIYEIND